MREENQYLSWLNQYHTKEPRLGLDRVLALLELVGNPHLQKPVIHIGGTNGKGSTVAHLTNLLMGHGQSVAVFSSPYIESYEEQFSIDFKPMDTNLLIQYIQKYQNIFAENKDNLRIQGITEFELITVLAYDYFAQSQVDYVIMEVGLGGQLDSTNVCQSILAGITTIGLDHVAILGDTLEEVAAQKAGIIKSTSPVVTGNIEPSAMEVIKQKADQMGVPVYAMNEAYRIHLNNYTDQGRIQFDYESPWSHYQNLQSPLLGKHQAENAAMSIQLFEVLAQSQVWDYSQESVQAALLKTHWPGRMEEISKDPQIILDGAHNPHAIWRLVDNMNEIFSDSPVDILFACINTKDIQEMLQLMHQIQHDQFIITTFAHENAYSLDELEANKLAGDQVMGDWQAFLDNYLKEANSNQVLLITGSLYFTSQVRAYLLSI